MEPNIQELAGGRRLRRGGRGVGRRTSPDALIRHAVDEVTATIKADKEIQAGNRRKITGLVDTKIAPYVNFARMTQTAVGRNWAKATPEQQATLTREFKRLLTNTYAGALSSYRAETVIEYKPLHATMPAGDIDAVVRSVIKGTAPRSRCKLDYYLEKGEGGWKVVDMNVMGISPGGELQGPVQRRNLQQRHRWADQEAYRAQRLQRIQGQVLEVGWSSHARCRPAPARIRHGRRTSSEQGEAARWPAGRAQSTWAR